MLTIVPISITLLIYYKIALVMLLVTLFSLSQCQKDGDRRVISRKLDNIFEKYMTAIKRLSDDFPNHQIELHLDIAGEDPQKPPRRVNYIHLREPPHLAGRTGGNNRTEGKQIDQPISLPLPDAEMRPVLMKDLKKAIEDLEKKYSGQLDTNDMPNKPNVDVNMKSLLQLLEKGTLVDSEIPKPPEENMSWLQIKIPK